MSENAGAVAVESTPAVATSDVVATPAPATAPTVAAPTTTTESTTLPTVPSNAREAREALRQRNRGNRAPAPAAAPTPAPAVTEQPRDDAGRFAPKESAVAAPAPTAATPAVSEPVATPKAVPEVRAELPEWHTLRKDRGKRFLDELAPHEQVRVVNDIARMGDVEAEARTLREKLARMEAERQLRSDPARDPLADPNKRAIYEDLKRAYPNSDAADKYLAGERGNLDAEIDKKAGEITQREQVVQVARRFKADFAAFAQEAATNPTMLPAWKQGYGELERQLATAAQEYGTLVEMGLREPTIEGFKNDLRLKYAADPRAQALFQQQQAQLQAQTQAAMAAEAARRAAEEAAAREKEQLLAAAQTRGRNPMGALPTSGLGAGGAVGPQSAREARDARRARLQGRLRG